MGNLGVVRVRVGGRWGGNRVWWGGLGGVDAGVDGFAEVAGGAVDGVEFEGFAGIFAGLG